MKKCFSANAFFSTLLLYLVFVLNVAYSEEMIQIRPVETQLPSQIVFIPGILGSSISVDGQTVWGAGYFNGEKLRFHKDQSVEVGPLSRFDIYQGINIGQTVYGDFFDELYGDFHRETRTSVFSYDWRQSNIDSANDLNRFLCAEINIDEPIVFVAHSMGGLVLKHWLREHFSSGCPTSNIPFQLERVSFVATPHFGAPKSVLTFLGKERLVEFGPLNRLVAGDLNKYGPTFDSIYELFPFSHAYKNSFTQSDMCSTSEKINSTRALSYRVAAIRNGGSAKAVDIFSAQVLMNFGVDTKFTDIQIQNYESYLQGKLDSARSAICKLMEYDFPPEIEEKFHFIAAKEDHKTAIKELTTVGQVLISNTKITSRKHTLRVGETSTGSPFYVYVVNTHGDDTVPFEIAKYGLTDFRQYDMVTNEKHLSILTSATFKERLEALKFAQVDTGPVDYFWTEGASTDLAWNNLPRYSELIASSNSSAHTDTMLVAQQNDAWRKQFVDLAGMENENTIQFLVANGPVIDLQGIYGSNAAKFAAEMKANAGDSVYQFVKSVPDNGAADWQFVAGLGGLSDVRRGWAINNGSFEYFNEANYLAAAAGFNTAKDAITFKNIEPLRLDINLKQSIYRNSAWNNIALGDFQSAKSDLESYSSFGGSSVVIEQATEYINSISGFEIEGPN